MMKVRLASFLALAIAAGDATAAVQSLDAIEAAVSRYAAAAVRPGDDVEIAVGRLDPRLRLPACDRPLATRFAHERRAAGANSVEVRCESAKPWSLYVSVDIDRYADIVVALRPVAKGAALASSDLGIERRKLSAAQRDYMTDPGRVSGQIAVRAIAAGQALHAGLVESPLLVRRGQRVVLLSSSHAISVRMHGTALEDGVRGEWISARNVNSDRVVEGVVSERGTIVVDAHTAVQNDLRRTAQAANRDAGHEYLR